MPAPTDARRYQLLDLALERDAIPDAVLRLGSRYGAWDRLRRERRGGIEAQDQRLRELVAHKSSGPIAEATEEANEQHYELPADFLGLILGPRRKYSGCLWGDGVTTLAEAEEAMLRLSCERAQVQDGMEILDLGCGWGSLSLWLAEQYPSARILGVSNSHGQREHIESVARAKGFTNLEVRTCDVNVFETDRRFDRVMSIEMFEHLRNWKELLARVNGWLEPGGKLFVHVFSQRQVPYRFEGTWAAERFFTAGLMPSHELLLHFQDDLVVRDRWVVDGTHYARTLVAWLANLDGRRDEALAILERVYPPREARRVLGGWRLFLLSTDEIWRWRGGDEWLVSHYLLEPRH